MGRVSGTKHNDYNRVLKWTDTAIWSPAPRYRRSKVNRWLRGVPEAASLLDVGCANGQFLRQAKLKMANSRLFGIDISFSALCRAQQALPNAHFVCMDIEQGHLSHRFEIVVCMEVVEHCRDYRKAIANIAAMTGRWLVITVPCGPLFEIDRRVGHVRHFQESYMRKLLAEHDLEVRKAQSWGFPFFNIYKHIINLYPDYFMRSFLGNEQYSTRQRILSLSAGFTFAFCLPVFGYQLFILAERTS